MKKLHKLIIPRRGITGKKRLLHLCLMLLVLTVFNPSLPVHAATSNTGPDNTLLQFVSGGHVLGFAPDGIYAGTGSHALKVEFVDSLAVLPVAESADSNQNTAAPLDKVTYSSAWKGVDIVYTSADGSIFESTYNLNLPESVNNIRLRYNRPVSIDGQGNLVISFKNGNMLESAPVAWQEIAGQRTPVQVYYVIYDGQEVGFTLANCQPGLAVTIDPNLTWNTFLGSNAEDQGNAIALDPAGNIYITGNSNATWGSPVRDYSAGSDGFVAKLNNNGALIWNTFLGGGGDDTAWSVALDQASNIFVIGTSSMSWGTPKRTFSDYTDAFVARLANGGALMWNTFLGSTGPDGGYGIAADAAGNIYVTGSSHTTWGTPVWDPGGDSHAFAAKLTGDGAITWNTFMGGTGEDAGFKIAVSPDLNVYIAGYSGATWGTPKRPYSSGYDGFAARLNSGGALQWNTFLGTAGYDSCNAITIDAASNAYVTGESNASWGNPLRAYSSNGDCYAAKLDGNGNLVWNTFLGGSGDDGGGAIAIGPGGNLYVAGVSKNTWGNPVRPYTPSLINTYGDGFAGQLNNNGVLVWNTFLGSNQWESCNGIAVDAIGNSYVAGTGNGAWGSPVRDYTYGMSTGPEPAQTCDAFAAEISALNTTQASINTILGAVNLNTDAGSISTPGWVPAADIRCSTPSGFIFPYGMISFNIERVTAGQTARITLRFPSPLPLGTKYYKCINGSMVDCSSLVTRINEYTLQIALTDGGLCDADGIANGTIVDPGGPAFPLNIPQSSSPQMPVTPQKPVSLSNITVKSASLSTTKVTPGSPVTVTANVANTGTGNGTSVVKVYVNGAEEAQQGVTVNSGGITTVTFDVSRNEPGTYTVYVGGTNAGTFTVDQFTPDTILFTSGAMVFFALVLGVIRMTKRRA